MAPKKDHQHYMHFMKRLMSACRLSGMTEISQDKKRLRLGVVAALRRAKEAGLAVKLTPKNFDVNKFLQYGQKSHLLRVKNGKMFIDFDNAHRVYEFLEFEGIPVEEIRRYQEAGRALFENS
jgi:hypothetical protein